MNKRREARRLEGISARPARRPRPEALEWLNAAGGARITIASGASALVENHRGVIELSRERITFRTRGGSIEFRGAGLKISELRREAALVTGRIESVFLNGGDEG